MCQAGGGRPNGNAHFDCDFHNGRRTMATKKTTTSKKTKGLKRTTAKKKAPAKRTTAATATANKTTGSKAGAKMSQMAAAECVLAEAGEPMNCQQMVEAMTKKRLWKSPGGKTSHATLYASLFRHIRKHGKDARFRKTDRGMFALTGRKSR